MTRARALWASVDALAAAIVLVLFSVAPGMNRFLGVSVVEMVQGTALQPYVWRALVPLMARLVVAAMPASLKAALAAAASHDHALAAMFTAANYPSQAAAECLVVTGLVYASFLGFVIAMRHALRAFYDLPPLVERVAPVVTLLFVPCFFGYASFMYDGATLLFAAAGLVLIARERWTAYLVLFTVALFNKETASLLLVPFVASQAKKMPRAKLVALVVVQLVAIAASRWILRGFFSHNPGQYLTEQLTAHNAQLLGSPPIVKLAICGALAALVAQGWRDKPRVLRWSILTLVPLVGACAIYGYLDELRAYYDAYPVVALLATPSAVRLASRHFSKKSPLPK